MSRQPMNHKEKAESYLNAASAPVPPSVKTEAVQADAAEMLTPPDVKEPAKKQEEAKPKIMVRANRPGFFRGSRKEAGAVFQVYEHELGRWMDKI